MGPSKRGGGEGAAGKRACARACGQAQDGMPDTAGELSAKGPAGGEVGQRAAVVQAPAPARGKGSDDLTDTDEHGVHGIDRAHELLLALQSSSSLSGRLPVLTDGQRTIFLTDGHRTGNGPDKHEPGRSQGCLGLRRGEDRPPAAGRGVTDASKKADAATSGGVPASEAQKASGGDYDAFDYEESLMAAQTLSGLAQKMAAEKKERKNFGKDTVDELKKWFASHLDHPYPDEEDKEELARKTNLNVAQVSYWFVNARKRIWQPLLHEKHAGTLTGYAKVTASDMLRNGTGSGAAAGAKAGEKAAVTTAGQAGTVRAPPGARSATSALSALLAAADAATGAPRLQPGAPLAASDAATSDDAGARCKGSSIGETYKVDAAAVLSALTMHGAAGVVLGAKNLSPAPSVDKLTARSLNASSAVLSLTGAALGGLVSGFAPPGAPVIYKPESAAERREDGGQGASAGKGGGQGGVEVVCGGDQARTEASGGESVGDESVRTCPLKLQPEVAEEKDVTKEVGRKRDRTSVKKNDRDQMGGETQEVRGSKRQVRRKEAIAT